MAEQDWRRRLIVGITGASGTIYGVRVLQVCRELGLDMRGAELKALARKSYMVRGKINQIAERKRGSQLAHRASSRLNQQ